MSDESAALRHRLLGWILQPFRSITGLTIMSSLCGAIAGTAVYPVAGTLFGMFFGAVAGISFGLMRSPLHEVAKRRNSRSASARFRSAQVFGGIGLAIIFVMLAMAITL